MGKIVIKIPLVELDPSLPLLDRLKKHMEERITSTAWVNSPRGGSGTSSANAFYGTVWNKVSDIPGLEDTEGLQISYQYPCHKYIQYYQNTKGIWSAWANNSGEAGDRYFDWLVNASPWVSAGIIPDKVSKTYMKEVGFVWDDLDKRPANLLHNFLVATRMAAEWKYFIQSWDKLVLEHGINPSLAFYHTTMWYCDSSWDLNTYNWLLLSKPDKKDVHLAYQDKYDWPLDTMRGGEQYLLNFIQGKAVAPSDWMFFPSASTKPVNTVWGQLYSNDSITGDANPNQYRVFLKNTYGKGSFTTKFTTQEVVEIIKQEQVRLAINGQS